MANGSSEPRLRPRSIKIAGALVHEQRSARISRSRENHPAIADRSSLLRRRRKSKRSPLVRPRQRKINETLEAVAARQASLDCRLNDIWRKESERHGHPNRSLGLAFSQCERLESLAGVGLKFVQPAITEAGNEPQVRGLVAAFQPDTGETLGSLLQKMPPAANSTIPAGEGYVIVDPKAFHADFAADLPANEANFMAISQVPISTSAFGTPITNAAWRNKPSWYAVATQDREINPDLERFMAKRAGSTTIEVKGSHAIYMSQPAIVAKLIETAAKEAK